ncbi:kinase-like domain-containing protein [Mycena metata]|uniref:Kinase-like domain-containing protein n=1 Tax=Mycena metata TaxID=1033252 RepID=A0AAD7HSA4_9AGAR|nr:kinase-like domain-containing protein [Mycena metata]KAJ7726228.1 kinase-like domain-containing protein [Mycena metata]
MASAKYPKVVGYDLVQQIGGGGFSKVFRAVNVQEHRVAACKVITLTPETSEKDRKTIEKEMRIHAALKHINILEFKDAVVVELKHQQHFVPGFYMLLELAAGGDLFDKIAPDIGVGDEVAHYYFNQLLAGMDYIHKEGVCHRDLKPENLLLDVAGTLKISDFGLSSVFKLKETGRTRTLTERCGSLPYVAPELNSDRPYEAEPIDVWGVGVILYTLLAGNTPWDEPTKHSVEFTRYLSGEIFQEEPWNRFSDTALSLLQGLLTIDPRERFTLEDAFQHPWCMRPSQLAQQGSASLAQALTESLRTTGDLDLASPNFNQRSDSTDDEDEPMLSAAHNTQFTQTLMLFSQTQSGTRYTPHLTRFYASLPPDQLMPLVQGGLSSLGVTCREAPPSSSALRLRIGGQDARKETFRGWVEVESFEYHGSHGSFCIMQKDSGNPISWRQLWRALIQCPPVEPHVLRKRVQ